MKDTADKKEFHKIVEKAKQGNIHALEKLLKNIEKKSYAVLYYLTKDENETDEILQDVLLKVSKNIKDLKSTESLNSWLNKIIIRKYYDFKRKNFKKEQGKVFECVYENEPKDIKREPIDDVMGIELIKAIKESICKLSEPYRLAIIMREFEGLSYDEIAKATKTNVGTVKSRIARARSQLKEYIKPYIN